MDEKDKHTHILSREDSHYLFQTWKTSAEELTKLSDSGEDISTAIPVLIRAYKECSQVPALESIADALFSHLLKSDEDLIISQFIDEVQYPTYFLRSFEKRVKMGASISKHIHWLLRFFNRDKYVVSSILYSYVEYDEARMQSRLLEVSQAIRDFDRDYTMLPAFLQESLWRKCDMSESLPILCEYFESREKVLASRTLNWVTEKGASLEKIEGLLNHYLSDETICGNLAQSLGYYYAYNALEAKAEKLYLNHNPEIRTRSVSGSSLCLFRSKDIPVGPYHPILFKYLLMGLHDDEDSAQQVSYNFLIRGRELNLWKGIKKSDITQLVEWLSKNGSSRSTTNHQNLISSNRQIDREKVQYVRDFLFLYLTETVERPTQWINRIETFDVSFFDFLRKGSKVCSICMKIKREGTYGGESELPTQFKSLTTYEKTNYNHDIVDLKQCPQCKSFYQYVYEEDEDFGRTSSITLRKLHPQKIGEYLIGKAQEDHLRRIASILDQARIDLNHPVEFQQGEATWILTPIALMDSNLELLGTLVVSRSKIIRETIVPPWIERIQAFTFSQKSPLPQYEELLTQAISDPSDTVVGLIAKGLTYFYLTSGQTQAVISLLHSSTATIREKAVESIYDCLKEKVIVENQFLNELIPLLKSENAVLRRFSRYCLEIEKENPKILESLIQSSLECLAIRNTEIAKDALQILAKLIISDADWSRLLTHIEYWLDIFDSRYYALQTVKNQMQKGHDPTQIISKLYSFIESDGNVAAFEIISTFHSTGGNIDDGIRAISSCLSKSSLSYQALDLLRSLPIEKLYSVEESIKESAVSKHFEALHEGLVYLLTDMYFSQGKIEKIRSLLESERRQLRGACATRLAQTADKHLLELKGLIPTLDSLLQKDGQRGRENAKIILDRLRQT